MSERSLRRRLPTSGTKTKPPHPLPSPRHRAPSSRRSSRRSKPVPVLQRCYSEPILWTVGLVVGDDRKNLESDFLLFRPQSSLDVFSASSLSLLSQSPRNNEGYNRDSKVVVNVTVEGSPGPIRTMVKLGSSVDETIRLVIDKYGKEGRSPQLDPHAAPFFELHQSYFSLESLDKSDSIGDVGSRSFYLRKSSSGRNGVEEESVSVISEIVPVRSSLAPPIPQPSFFLPGFLGRKISKIIRRTRKFWRVLGCMQAG